MTENCLGLGALGTKTVCRRVAVTEPPFPKTVEGKESASLIKNGGTFDSISKVPRSEPNM